ncbi:AzlD domain-containing protein [Bacillus horti]|uniref:Branched-subunit amino acid transport protein n=1 Tax=Caldalkalibacillus horti TaxID=77523 RepID=A0ABT9W1H6_9BACI|nr:AzlD domain-containing protein [Bacillus horti]MDQ0167066.1 branched-subunit amino acid transport protein [Bacillus horti]
MIYWLIFGMFVVTYIPRMLPMLFIKGISFPPIVERWLSYIPYAALGALIFPGVLTVDQSFPMIGLMGALVAFLCAWNSKNILIPLIASVLTVYLFQQYVFV